MEFVWETSALDRIFVHMLHDHYDPPHKLHWKKALCFHEENYLQVCRDALYELYEKQAAPYSTDKLLLVYGDDFSFDDYEFTLELFSKFSNVMQFINSDEDSFMKIKFATASEYFDAVASDNPTLAIYTGDFFPYVSTRDSEVIHWTGYYTTRPLLKQRIFESHRLARATELLMTFIAQEEYLSPESCLVLHHDAITGTCKPHVEKDYIRRLERERVRSIKIVEAVINSVFMKNEGKQYSIGIPVKVVIVFNTLNWEKDNILHISSHSSFIEIIDWNFEYIESQAVFNEFTEEFNIYFKVKLAGLSLGTIFIREYSHHCKKCSEQSVQSTDKTIMKNPHYEIKFMKGMIEYIHYDREKLKLKEQFWIHDGSTGGAYIYKPRNKGHRSKGMELKSFTIYTGSIVQVASTIWKRKTCSNSSGDLYYHRILLDNTKKITLKIGLYACYDDEILLKFTLPDIHEENWLYTCNSADIRSRRYFERALEHHGDNMYPAPGGIVIKLKQNYLTFNPEFSIGVVMSSNNSFGLLLHRKLSYNDKLGLGEGLHDDNFVEHTFKINIGKLHQKEYFKSYFEAKSPFALFPATIRHNKINIEHNLSKSLEDTKDWNFNTFYSIGLNDETVYLSSAVRNNKKTILRLVAYNDSVPTTWQGISLRNETFFGGYTPKTPLPVWQTSQELSYSLKENRDHLVFPPFKLAAYSITLPESFVKHPLYFPLPTPWKVRTSQDEGVFLSSLRQIHLAKNPTPIQTSFSEIFLILAFLALMPVVFFLARYKKKLRTD